MKDHVVVWDGRRTSSAGPYLFAPTGLLAPAPAPAAEPTVEEAVAPVPNGRTQVRRSSMGFVRKSAPLRDLVERELYRSGHHGLTLSELVQRTGLLLSQVRGVVYTLQAQRCVTGCGERTVRAGYSETVWRTR